METTKLFFPIWMMFINPVSWAAIIPGTFLIAFFGLIAALYIARPDEMPRGERFAAAWNDAKKSVWRAWINLCASYAIGTALMLAPAILTVGMAESNILRQAALAITETIYHNALAIIWAVLCVLISGAVNFILSRSWTFRKTDMEDIRRSALWLAFLTAPYLFFSTFQLFY